jgi:superfamily II DNA or RNA helicase
MNCFTCNIPIISEQYGEVHRYSCPACKRFYGYGDIPSEAKKASVSLRDYQQSWVSAIQEASSHKKRILAVAPTGSGKRYCIVFIANEAVRKGNRVLIVSDRRIIVFQASDEMDNFDLHHGIIMGNVPSDESAMIQIASIQTLRSRCIKRNYPLPPADVILVDEAHKDPIAYREIFDRYPNATMIGFTATAAGPDGTALVPGLYDQIVDGPRTTDLIRRGFLLPTKVLAPSEPYIEGVKISGKREYNQAELGVAVEACTLFGDVLQEWEPYMDRPTIVFAPLLKYAHALVDDFTRVLGPDTAEVIEADTKTNERERMIGEFEDGKIRVLLSVDVLREGFDGPAVCGIDLQPNHQLRTYVQKCGRIRRAREGYREAVMIDMAGNYHRHPHPDEDIDWLDMTSDKTTEELVRQHFSKKEKKTRRCPSCYTAYTGAVCPTCGAKPVDPVHVVRMGKGKLEEVPVKRPKKNVEHSPEHKAWMQALFVSHHRKGTLRQAGFFYKKKIGKWPSEKDGLWAIPSSNDPAWNKPPSETYGWLAK